MAKNKRELQADLEAANKVIAELSQSNRNANINNDKPPSWLKTFLGAQSESQRQMQRIQETIFATATASKRERREK